jgi:GNAT superfamily N-acetyltransferase
MVVDSAFSVRHAMPADAARIAQIESEGFPPAEAASRPTIEERIAAFPDFFWLALRDDAIAGFVSCLASDEPDLSDEMFSNASLHKADGKWLMIMSVCTDSEYRGQGCASALLKRVIADARAAGRQGLVLTCKEPLLGFYARQGFVDEGLSASEHGGVAWHQMRLRW